MERIVVLGLGNILYGDEGFGVRVAEQLYSRYAFPDNVEIVDAGTQGHPLLASWNGPHACFLLDAVDFGLQPGTIIEKDSTGIPAYLSAHKISLHQNSFSEVLALAELKDCLPEEIRLIGAQPLDMTYGNTLSPCCCRGWTRWWVWRYISFRHGAFQATRRTQNPHFKILRSRLSGTFLYQPDHPHTDCKERGEKTFPLFSMPTQAPAGHTATD